MVLLRLALKNARIHFSRYLAYVLACTVAIIIYFTFTVMATTPKLLQDIAQQQQLKLALQITSFFIVLFIAAFMVYANLFFVQQRRQEIGLYNLLGVTRRQIGSLFFLENLILGLVALVLGLLFGVLLSKLFAMLLLRLIAVAVPTPLLFSWSAVGQTVTMFSLIFVGLALLDASVIYRYRLPELFHQPVLHIGEQLNYRHYFWGWLRRIIIDLCLLVSPKLCAGSSAISFLWGGRIPYITVIDFSGGFIRNFSILSCFFGFDFTIFTTAKIFQLSRVTFADFS